MPTPRPFTFYTDGTGIFYTVDGVNFIQVGGGAAGSIPLSELATQSQATVVGNPSGSGTQSPVALTQTQLTALINPATAALPGAMTATQAAAVQSGVPAGGWWSAVIDMTQTGTTLLIQPCPFRLWRGLLAFEIKSTNTVTVSPTLSYGSDASFANLGASQTPAAFTSQAAETAVNPTALSPLPLIDLTTNGFGVNVITGATATALTVRALLLGTLIPV